MAEEKLGPFEDANPIGAYFDFQSPLDAQQFAIDHMARGCRGTSTAPARTSAFPADKVPASLVPFLGLDETRHEAIEALVNQARTDADMANSKCAYADTNPVAVLICRLFESTPPALASNWWLAASGESQHPSMTNLDPKPVGQWPLVTEIGAAKFSVNQTLRAVRGLASDNALVLSRTTRCVSRT